MNGHYTFSLQHLTYGFWSPGLDAPSANPHTCHHYRCFAAPNHHGTATFFNITPHLHFTFTRPHTAPAFYLCLLFSCPAGLHTTPLGRDTSLQLHTFPAFPHPHPWDADRDITAASPLPPSHQLVVLHTLRPPEPDCFLFTPSMLF